MSDLDTRIEEALEGLYRLDRSLSVADFRIDRSSLVKILGARGPAEMRETLVVQHDGDETLLALFIAEEVMTRARSFARDLVEGARARTHLDAFCVATEGVSHFVYFTFCGEHLGRPVSQVELELQAEIDKFIVLRILFALDGAELLPSLFDRFELSAGLSDSERERYAVANQAGRRYARWLERQFARGRTAQAMEDARSLYRKPLGAKLEHIARAA